MARDLLPYAVPLGLLLLGFYVCHLAFRSRESELRQALRRSEIALQDAELRLQGSRATHAAALRRFEERHCDARPADEAAGKSKFRDAKSAFARLFHPDAADGDERERAVRAEMFKRYWTELERIDRC